MPSASLDLKVPSEFTQQDGETLECDKHDRVITCVLRHDLQLTPMFSGLYKKICLKESEVWRKVISNKIIVTLVTQGLPSVPLRNTGGQSLPRSQCYRRESKMVDEVEYSQFLAVHEGQLIMADIPEQYWTTLHKKLKNEASFMPVSEYIAEFSPYF